MRPSPPGRAGRLPLRGLAIPTAYSVAFHVGVTTFFTWAADMLRRGGLDAGLAGALYVLVGLVGLVALATGGWCARFGTVRVAAACLLSIAVSLAVLGVGAGSALVALGAAVVFAPGIMGGAAVLAVWTAELAPERSGEALTVVVAVGAVSAVVAPAVIGPAARSRQPDRGPRRPRRGHRARCRRDPRTSNRYPRPASVTRWRGREGSGSSLRRRLTRR